MTKELLKQSGLDVEIGKDKLIFDKAQFPRAIDWVKTFDDGKYAYLEANVGPPVLYGGIRYAEDIAHEAVFQTGDFMADITFINSGKIGDEYIKSVGHYHGCVPGTEVAYPEIYEAVTSGIEYCLQSEPDTDNGVNVLWVLTEPGDKIMMLPNWGHVSMNTGEQTVIEVDVQKRDNPNHSDYSLYKIMNGAAVYRTERGLIKNSHYKIKSLRIVRPKELPELGLTKDTPLYTALTSWPNKFQFLLEPQNASFIVDMFFEDIPAPFEVFDV